jgi:hypothetical protein
MEDTSFMKDVWDDLASYYEVRNWGMPRTDTQQPRHFNILVLEHINTGQWVSNLNRLKTKPNCFI